VKLRLLRLCAASAAVALLASAGARAAWEPAKVVDNQGAGAGSTGDYLALADAPGGAASAFFEQTVGSGVGYFAIRRGARDSAWGAPQADAFPAGMTVFGGLPLAAAAGGSGDALGVTVQQNEIWESGWPAGAGAPSPWAPVLADARAPDLSDPQVAFDAAGNGYVVSGQPQGSSFGDQPIWLSVYSPASGTWSAAAPISDRSGATSCATGRICGQEPRLAVSPDGTVVVVYLKNCAGQVPMSTQCQLFAARAPAGAVAGGARAAAFGAEEQISQSGDQVPETPYPGGSSASNPPNYDVAVDGSDLATIVDAESQSGFDNQILATQWPASAGKPDPAVAISAPPPPAGAEPPASEPRVAADAAGDVTAVWTEPSQSSPPPADALFSAEVISGRWTAPEPVAAAVDSPTNPQGYAVDTPPFWLAEDPAGTAWLVWTDNGALQDAVRQPGRAWSSVDTIAGVAGALAGSARVASGLAGQADALVVAADGSRSALYASRFTAPAPLPPPSPTAPAPQPGPAANGASPPARAGRPRPRPSCRARPVSRIARRLTRASYRAITVVGTASEHRCAHPTAAVAALNRVIQVYVMIYHPAPHGRCRFLTRNGFLTPPTPCRRPIEFLASGTTVWRLTLHVRAPAGIYLIRSDAVDGFARHQRHSAASVERVVVRRAARGRRSRRP